MSDTIYKIGTKYKTSGKNSKECTVIDILKTYNSKNELVSIRYVSEHDFLGQRVTNKDVVAVTIARGLISEPCTCGGITDHDFTMNCVPF